LHLLLIAPISFNITSVKCVTFIISCFCIFSSLVIFDTFVSNSDSLDWKDLSAAEITDRVVSRTKSGSIVLFHNAAKHTPEALPSIIEALQAQGYTFCKVSEMIYKENYTINHERRQCKTT